MRPQCASTPAALILAAGMGRRLGRGPKAFVRMQGETLLQRAYERLRRVDVHRVWAVLPPPPDPCALPRGLHVLRNPDPDSGQLGSLLLALDTIDDSLDSLILYPVDHYAVDDDDLLRLIAARQTCAPEVARILPQWRGKRGHPLLILPPALKRLRALEEEGTTHLRDVLRAAGPALTVQAHGPGVGVNLNSEADWPEGIDPLT